MPNETLKKHVILFRMRTEVLNDDNYEKRRPVRRITKADTKMTCDGRTAAKAKNKYDTYEMVIAKQNITTRRINDDNKGW